MTDRRFYGLIAGVGTLVAGLFAACAEGSSPETGSGGSSTTGTPPPGDGGIPPGQIGGPCEFDDDCVEGKCTKVGAGKVCTVACPPPCPEGTYCSLVQGDPICIADVDQQCRKCTAPVDCAQPSDACLESPLGDHFCAMDCTTMGDCPNGFTCAEKAEYLAGGGPGGMDGGADGGLDGGTDAGTDGGASGSGGGPKPPAGEPHKFCVPSNGASCPCNEKRDGVEHTCKRENASGKCLGKEKCDGDEGSWKGCTAATPEPETCNAKDDNCDGNEDEGDPNEVCSSEGPKPPHADWACAAGQCKLGPCEAGWAAFPPGPAEDGCACPLESGEDNGTCAAATGAGTVSDASGTFIEIKGTISSATDADYWVFDTVDTNEGTTNSYHVSIDFTAPAANDEYAFDVMRGNVCTDAPAGPGVNVTTYDWCVDGTGPGGTEGELGCGATASVHCADHSSKYYLRVHRKLGAPVTCTEYVIKVTAKGGDACDFSKKCP